jgi:hypothetical protein
MLKTYQVPHPHNANMLVEMDVMEEEEEPEYIKGNTGGTPEYVPGLVKKEKTEMSPSSPGGVAGRPPTYEPYNEFWETHAHRAYIFISMLCNALGVHDVKEMLADPGKPFDKQVVARTKRHDESDTDYYDYALSSVVSAEIYGAIHRAYQRLRPEMSLNITMQDLITSPVTSDTFAMFCALLSKASTGSFAQPGRIYSGGRSMYYVNSGNENRRQIYKQITSHIMWFRGVRKYTQGELYYQKRDRFMANLL